MCSSSTPAPAENKKREVYQFPETIKNAISIIRSYTQENSDISFSIGVGHTNPDGIDVLVDGFGDLESLAEVIHAQRKTANKAMVKTLLERSLEILERDDTKNSTK